MVQSLEVDTIRLLSALCNLNFFYGSDIFFLSPTVFISIRHFVLAPHPHHTALEVNTIRLLSALCNLNFFYVRDIFKFYCQHHTTVCTDSC